MLLKPPVLLLSVVLSQQMRVNIWRRSSRSLLHVRRHSHYPGSSSVELLLLNQQACQVDGLTRHCVCIAIAIWQRASMVICSG